MGRVRPFLLVSLLTGFLLLFVSLSLSPLSSFEPRAGLPDLIDDVYLDFDSLRTDLSDYRWPTDAGKTMTSAFGAFRRTHFHAGIDISTGGRTGHRVFASRSGYIARILVSPTGYGKMLQIRHEDGFTTVYAHLSRFNDSLDATVRKMQYANERYSLDVRPEPGAFPVRQGDLIAFTGETGAGPPHLHFEIRDGRMNPANPLLAPDFSEAIRDTRRPEFEQITFAPFDHTGRIDGSAFPLTLSVRAAGPGLFSLPRSVRLNGAVSISSKASDRVNATWNKQGIYHYKVYLDSLLIYESRLDRFSAKQSEQIALHYDWPLVESGEGRFQKLFVEPGNRLPLYSRLPERGGVLESDHYAPGPHELLIVARDVHGNEARLQGTLFFDESPPLDVRLRETEVILSSSSNLASVTVASRSPDQRQWSRVSFSADHLVPNEEGLRLPVALDNGRLWRIQALNERGTPSHPVFICPPQAKTSETSLDLRKHFFRDYVVVTVASHLPFTERPSLWVKDGESRFIAELFASDERTSSAVIPLGGVRSVPISLEARGVVNGAEVEAFDEVTVYPVTPEAGGLIVAGNGEFVLEFPPDGVYQTLYVRVEKTESGYAAFPQDVLLNAGATVRLAANGTDGYGLFALDSRERSLLSGSASDGFFEGRVTKFLSEFALMQDTVPPTLSSLSVRHASGKLQIRFGLRDNLSGIDHDALRLTVDDRLVIAAYDPEKRLAMFDEPFVLSPGLHNLRIEARDRMGNRVFLTRSFRTR